MPRKGSVVQGTSTREENGVPNVTRNGIDVQVRSRNDFTIVNTGGVTDWTLTEDDLRDTDPGSPLEGNVPVSENERLFTTITVRVTTNNPTREDVARDLANGDWFALGIWQRATFRGWSFTGELGAFVDGGNLVEHAIDPGAGTAEYRGAATGVYLAGEFAFNGEIRLTSNFEEGTISGGITGFPRAAKLELLAADITEGFFRGEMRAEGADNVSGYWGGNFAGGSASDNTVVPSHAIGTFGGRERSSSRFIGTFLAQCRSNCGD